MRQRGVEPEPAEHVGGGQGREVAQRADAEPAQQIDQRVTADRGDVEPGEERPGAPRRHDAARARREPGREHAVGDAHLRLDRAGLGDLLDEVLGGRLLAAEVSGRAPGRERAHPRPDHVDTGRDRLDGRHHGLERPRVPRLVVLDDMQLRAAGLRLALAQTEPDALGPGRGGAGDDPVGLDHDDGLERGHAVDDAGGHHRPVGAPNEQRTTHNLVIVHTFDLARGSVAGEPLDPGVNAAQSGLRSPVRRPLPHSRGISGQR